VARIKKKSGATGNSHRKGFKVNFFVRKKEALNPDDHRTKAMEL